MKKTLLTSLKCALLFSSFIAVGHTMQNGATHEQVRSYLTRQQHPILGTSHQDAYIKHFAGLESEGDKINFMRAYHKDSDPYHKLWYSDREEDLSDERERERSSDLMPNLSRQPSQQRLRLLETASSSRDQAPLLSKRSLSRGGFQPQPDPREEQLREAQELIIQAQELIAAVLRG